MLEPGYLEQKPNHRAVLIRRVLILTPMAVIVTALFLVAFGNRAWVPVVILGLATLAADIEALSALRDLRARPVTTRGVITRLLKKSRFLFFGRVDYMFIGRTLFEIGAIAASELRPGDEVVIEHWPHSNLVISLARPPLEPGQ